jgi:hypothetical protein
LDEAFSFAVGSGPVGSGSQVTQLEFLAGGLEPVRDITGAVVGHDGFDLDAAVLEPGDRAPEEARGGRGPFVGQDLGIGQAGSVVDRDVNELPANASHACGAVSVDAMTDTADTPQLLDVDVDQLTRAVSLVSDDRLFGLEALEPREAGAGQDASHGGRTQAHPGCDLWARAASSAQTQNLLDSDGMRLSRHPVRPRTAIDQRRLAGLSIPSLPLEGRPPRYTGRLGGAGHRHPSPYSVNQENSTGWASSGILVKLHLGSFGQLLALDTSSLTDLGPDGQQTYP